MYKYTVKYREIRSNNRDK